MQNNTGYRSFVASVALIKGNRVMLDSGTGANNVTLADNSNYKTIGVVESDVQAGDIVGVKLLTAPGTFEVIAHSAIAAGALVYAAANGLVDDAATTGQIPLFQAIQSASADGDIFEVARISNAPASA